MTTGIQFLKSISKDKTTLTSTTQRAFNNVNDDLLYNSSLNLKAGINYDSLISISVCYILICSLLNLCLSTKKILPNLLANLCKLSNFTRYLLYDIVQCIVYLFRKYQTKPPIDNTMMIVKSSPTVATRISEKFTVDIDDCLTRLTR